MLGELKDLHADLLAAIDELERLTSEPTPHLGALAATRLKLTRASRRRNAFLEASVYPALARNRAAEAPVRQLRDEDRNRLVASANHIAKWSPAEIGARWADYCAASHSLRTAMRSRVREEQALLYPLLRD